MASFSRSDEAESDQEGIRYVMRAGIDPRGIPEMFRILIKERNDHPSGGIDSGFRTHPMEEERVRATESTIARMASEVRVESPCTAPTCRATVSVASAV
jgi:predicted Zn-dependent protease